MGKKLDVFHNKARIGSKLLHRQIENVSSNFGIFVPLPFGHRFSSVDQIKCTRNDINVISASRRSSGSFEHFSACLGSFSSRNELNVLNINQRIFVVLQRFFVNLFGLFLLVVRFEHVSVDKIQNETIWKSFQRSIVNRDCAIQIVQLQLKVCIVKPSMVSKMNVKPEFRIMIQTHQSL